MEDKILGRVGAQIEDFAGEQSSSNSFPLNAFEAHRRTLIWISARGRHAKNPAKRLSAANGA
jgi:hypothetical protein